MVDNPYMSPSSSDEAQIPGPMAPNLESLLTIAKSVFLAWEKLRSVYVGVLAMTTLGAIVAFGSVDQTFVNGELVFVVVVGVLGANVLYFAGPFVETYVRWLGFDHTWPRWAMFAGGRYCRWPSC